MFEKNVENAQFLSPLKEFQLDVQPVEYRRDPLTKSWCRINVKRAKRVKQGQIKSDYSDLVEKSAKKCFFCPDNIEKDTPRFPPEISKRGRLKLGETAVFPNLFPFAEYHAVATVSEKHFLDLAEFKQNQIKNTLQAGINYFRRVYGHDEEVKYPSFSWNYLPPSGASIVHPHVQLIADRVPTYLTDSYLKASAEYHKEHKENYWLKLIREEERLGVRFIGRTGDITWMTSFAPFGNNEVKAIFEDCSSLIELTPREINDFSKDVKKVLNFYAYLGVHSFNLTSYSAPMGEKINSFCLNMKIISRPSPQGYYTSDAGFMELLHRERIVEALPEDVAKEIQKFF